MLDNAVCSDTENTYLVKLDLEEDFFFFDLLPKKLKDAINYAHIGPLSSLQMYELYKTYGVAVTLSVIKREVGFDEN